MNGFPINPRAVYYIAKKEFTDNLRNKWIIALTSVFIILTIATSYLSGAQAGNTSSLGGMENTVVTLLSISSMLIPIIAVMLGYSAISGDAESGALALVLACPIRRTEILLGKFIGLGSVLGVSTVVGFGTGGLVIAAASGTASWKGYIAFIALATLLGLIYLSLSLFFSAICARRVTSLGAGVLVFFWSMIYGTVFFGLYLATGGSMEGLMSGYGKIPDWLWWSVLCDPNNTNQMTVWVAFGLKQAFGFEMEAPGFMNLGMLVAAQLIWMLVPVFLAFYIFEKRDI